MKKIVEKEGAPFSPNTDKEGSKISPASFTQSLRFKIDRFSTTSVWMDESADISTLFFFYP